MMESIKSSKYKITGLVYFVKFSKGGGKQTFIGIILMSAIRLTSQEHSFLKPRVNKCTQDDYDPVLSLSLI